LRLTGAFGGAAGFFGVTASRAEVPIASIVRTVRNRAADIELPDIELPDLKRQDKEGKRKKIPPAPKELGHISLNIVEEKWFKGQAFQFRPRPNAHPK
jgi:hypothetical protein